MGNPNLVLDSTTEQSLRECSDEELRKSILETEELIYTFECFSVGDLIYLEMLYREADRRGWETEP